MNERHYGVAMLGWLPTHSSEIESYSANGGHPPNDILKETKDLIFSLEENQCASTAANECLISKLFTWGN